MSPTSCTELIAPDRRLRCSPQINTRSLAGILGCSQLDSFVAHIGVIEIG